MNDVPISSSTAIFFKTTKWTGTCRSPSWTNSITLHMILTGLFQADSGEMLWKGQNRSQNLSGTKNSGTRLGTARLLKKLTVGLSMFNSIPTQI